MRFPQVSDRVKEAPAQALRGVFAGIGQLLLFTDKLRNKTPAASRCRGPASRSRRRRPRMPPRRPRTPLRRSRMPLRCSGTPLRRSRMPLRCSDPLRRSRIRSADPDGPAEPEPEPTRYASRAARSRETRARRPARGCATGSRSSRPGQLRTAATASEEAAAGGRPADAPLPNYDELSIASLRARLRASTLRSSGSWSSTRRPTPPGPTSWPCSSAGSPSWRPVLDLRPETSAESPVPSAPSCSWSGVGRPARPGLGRRADRGVRGRGGAVS